MDINILHIVGDSKFGGASLGILRLAENWRRIGWHVQVLATDSVFVRQAAKRAIPVVPLDVIWREIRPLKDLRGLLRLYAHLRRTRPTIVHTHTTKAGFVGRIAAWLAGVPIVLHTVHGFAFHERSPWWKIAFYAALERIASIGSSRVVTVSHFHEDWARRLRIAPVAQLVAIPNGIPEPTAYSEAKRASVRAALGVVESETLLLAHGRLASEKGLEDLLQAVAIVAVQGSVSPRLVVAGSGPLRPKLERLASELRITSLVRFLGFRDDVSELLHASDIVVLPSWREGLSIALLEAMGHGRPIIATTIGSNREATIEGRAALLVRPAAPGELAGAITELSLDSGLRLALGVAARTVFMERYGIDRMLTSYHELYRTLLKENKSAATFSSLLPSADR